MAKLYVPLQKLEEELNAHLATLTEEERHVVVVLMNRAFDIGCIDSLRPRSK